VTDLDNTDYDELAKLPSATPKAALADGDLLESRTCEWIEEILSERKGAKK
jgi:hypothetical protein